MRYTLWIAAALAAFFFAPGSIAADARTEKRAELKEIHGKVETLKKDLSKSEDAHNEAADQLRTVELSISTTNRKLRDLNDKRDALKQELAKLEAQSQTLSRQISSQQGQIGTLLNRQYQPGNTDALQTLLSGQDPNQAARDFHFLTLLSQAKTTLVGDLNESLEEKHRLGEAVRDRTEQLAENEKQQQAQRAELLLQQKQRQIVLAKLADKIKNQKRELDSLKRDEKRLSNVIDQIARSMAARSARKPAKQARNGGPREEVVRNDPVLRNEKEPEPFTGGDFGSLRGRLRLPVRGDIANRFGSPRAEGTNWKGVFIRAGGGSEVKSVAPGRVVFSDYLRGFGNLIIIDHGDNYLTIYGNNESLLRQMNDKVKAGDVIASVGNSGGNPESGLYFELRHQGQVLDPLKWVNLH